MTTDPNDAGFLVADDHTQPTAFWLPSLGRTNGYPLRWHHGELLPPGGVRCVSIEALPGGGTRLVFRRLGPPGG